MYFVYVLLSKQDNQFYIGYTTDVQRRFTEHNNGQNASTKSRRPLILFYFEFHLNEFDARRRESYFKTTKGKSTLKQMLRYALLEHKFVEEAETTNVNISKAVQALRF